MEGITGNFTNSISSIGKFFDTLFGFLNPASKDFIFKGAFGDISDILDALNPTSDNFFLKQLFDSLNPASEKFFLKRLFSWLDPTSDNFIGKKIAELFENLFKSLFVPTNNPFEDLSAKFDEKFAFINQIKDLFSSFLGFNNYGDSVPSFTLTWYGTTVAIIDFSLFLDYRTWIHGIILAIAWAVFIFKTYRKLPTIIGGFSQ